MATLLSIQVLAILALLGGSAMFWRRPGMRKQAVLMIVLAVVLAANVAIMTVPGPDGTAPVDATPEK